MKFKRLFLLAVVLIFICGCTKDGGGTRSATFPRDTSFCGDTFRISNGEACSNPERSPVLKLWLGDESGDIIGMCSGTLVTPTAVLTAAHCVDQLTGIHTAFVDANNGGQLIEASQMIVHPHWQRFPGDPHDVGVLRLSSPITHRPTAPILLSRDLNSGDRIGIYGYGRDENDILGVLKEGKMKVSEISGPSIMAEYNNTGMSICSGDSGGPVTAESNGYVGIAAINSAGSAHGCLDDSIALFVSTSHSTNLNFILHHIPAIKSR